MGTGIPTKPRASVNIIVFAARLALPNSNCRSVSKGTRALGEHVHTMVYILSVDKHLYTVISHKMNGSKLNLLTLGMQNIRTCLASLPQISALLDPADALEPISPSGGTSQGCLHQVPFLLRKCSSTALPSVRCS